MVIVVVHINVMFPWHLCCRHAQILGTLQAFSHWLCQLNLDSLRNTQTQPRIQQTLRSLITTLVGAVTPLIVGGMPEKVVLPACQYLLSLVSTVKPRFLASLPSMQGLMERAAQGKLAELPNKVSWWVGLVGGVKGSTGFLLGDENHHYTSK